MDSELNLIYTTVPEWYNLRTMDTRGKRNSGCSYCSVPWHGGSTPIASLRTLPSSGWRACHVSL